MVHARARPGWVSMSASVRAASSERRMRRGEAEQDDRGVAGPDRGGAVDAGDDLADLLGGLRGGPDGGVRRRTVRR